MYLFSNEIYRYHNFCIHRDRLELLDQRGSFSRLVSREKISSLAERRQGKTRGENLSTRWQYYAIESQYYAIHKFGSSNTLSFTATIVSPVQLPGFVPNDSVRSCKCIWCEKFIHKSTNGTFIWAFMNNKNGRCNFYTFRE